MSVYLIHRYQQRGQCASASNKEESEAKALEALGGQLGVDHMIGQIDLLICLIWGSAEMSLVILSVPSLSLPSWLSIRSHPAQRIISLYLEHGSPHGM